MLQDNTIDRVALALDAALMRQTAIAANIAHANTKGYQAMGVDFETQLQNASQVESVQPQYVCEDKPVSVDAELALSLKNTTQYHALIKGLNHKFAIMALAVRGNNA